MSDAGPEHDAGRPGADEQEIRPIPLGCHPLVFGVTMATIQLGALLWLLKC